jgi:molecular chaperone GrpE
LVPPYQRWYRQRLPVSREDSEGVSPENKDPELDPTRLSPDDADGPLLPQNDELEEALRAATESVEATQSAREVAAARATGDASADKLVIEALADELQSLKREFDELTDRDLRLQAEFENFRRRSLKERQEAHNFGHQNIVKDLLPGVDNLERALSHTEDSEGADLAGLLQGIELVRRELLGVLGKHGVEKIEAAGVAFDPVVHEAMAQIENDEVEPNTVVQVLEEGYKLRDRMLRPARVLVSKRSSGAAGAGDAGPAGQNKG